MFVCGDQFRCSATSLQIYVKHLTGKTSTITLNTFDTVDHLKGKVQDKEGACVSKYIYMHTLLNYKRGFSCLIDEICRL